MTAAAEKSGATFFLKHHGKSKKVYGRTFAAEHLYYVARDSAATFIFAQHMPFDRQRAARFMTERWDTAKRKDARLWDDIILNLPYSLSESQRREAVVRFVLDITKGRTPVYAAIHSDTDAPHAHIIFVDADVESNTRVFGTSEAGSSHRLRWIWEKVLNQSLREAGLEDLQVSRRGRAWQIEHANDNRTALGPVLRSDQQQEPSDASKSIQTPVEKEVVEVDSRPRRAAVAEAEGGEQEPPGDDHGARVVSEAPMEALAFEGESLAEQVELVLALEDQLNTVIAKREAVEQYRRDYKQAGIELRNAERRAERLQAEFKALAAKHEKVTQELTRHRQLFGLMWNGVRIGSFATHKRVAAENAHSLAEITANMAAAKKAALERETGRLGELEEIRERSEASANAIKDSIAINGTEEDLEFAYQVHRHDLIIHLSKVNMVEVLKARSLDKISEQEHLRLFNLRRKYIEEERQRGWAVGVQP